MPDHPLDTLMRALGDEVDADAVLARRSVAFAQFDRRRRRRRLAAAGVAAACVLVGVLVSVSRASSPRGQIDRLVIPPGLLHQVPRPSPTVAQLAAGSWRTLPKPPLTFGDGSVAVWTGSRLFVWGGDTGTATDATRGLTSGTAAALYDPQTRTWATTPPSPIASRAHSIAVWTGREVLIWGGEVSAGTQALRPDDGAAYDPATHRWHAISATGAPRRPPEAVSAAGNATPVESGAWTGSRLVVVFGPFTATATETSVAASAYDPKTDRWQPLPSHTSSRSIDGLEGIDVIGTPRVAEVWLSWGSEFAHHTLPNGVVEGSESVPGVQELFALDPGSGWRPIRLGGPAQAVSQPLRAGHDVVAFGDRNLQTGCCSPPVDSTPTVVLGAIGTAASGARWVAAPKGPVFDPSDLQAWTGRVVLRLDTTTEVGGSRIALEPGDIAALDLDTRTWTSLPRAPYVSEDAELVWAGDRLIIWGDLIPSCKPLTGELCRPLPPTVDAIELDPGR
jgi:hypothetical protein